MIVVSHDWSPYLLALFPKSLKGIRTIGSNAFVIFGCEDKEVEDGYQVSRFAAFWARICTTQVHWSR
jgi:hypothetical protein